VNIVNKLTLRHMLLNKRRTLVTIIGVIVSVAMISAVTMLGLSFLDLLKRDTIANHGEWHMNYSEVPISKLDTVKSSAYLDELLLEHKLGFAPIEEQELEPTTYKPYIFVTEYNEAALDKLPVTLVEGRLPQRQNEIVVPKHYVQLLGESAQVIGKSITLNIGDRFYYEEDTAEGKGTAWKLDQSDSITLDEQKNNVESLVDPKPITYTIVGVIERLNNEYVVAPGYSFVAYLDEDSLSTDTSVNTWIYSGDPDKGIFADADRIASELGMEHYDMNTDLLRFQFISSNDNFMYTLYSMITIIMVVIMVGSISLIYNAFGISVADRSRYLGMLASVGATKRQKRNSVLFEGLIISAISIPLGILSAMLGLSITFAAINPLFQETMSLTEVLVLRVNIWIILVSIAISLLTIMLSVWWPARRAARVSAIDAIRQTQDVKLSRKHVKTSKITRKLFGIEAEIAMKNIKRNKRRYQITIFSLVISIVLFLTVSSLTDAMKRAQFSTSAGINYDISLYFEEYDESKIELLKQNELIKQYNIIESINSNVEIPVELLPKTAQKAIFGSEMSSTEQTFNMSVFFYALDDELLKEIAAKSNVNETGLFDPSHPQAILYNVNTYYSRAENRYVTDKSLLQTHDLNLPLVEWYSVGEDSDGNIEYEIREFGSIEIVGESNEAPLGVVRGQYGQSTIIAFVSKATLEQLNSQFDSYIQRNIYMLSDDPMALEKDVRENYDFSGYSLRNAYKSKQEEHGLIVIMNVFSYGFISLITLISIANILNTISTGIQLRKREFAMLRSIGMSEKGFYRMINYESILYGVKSLLYGLPTSALIMFLIYRSMSKTTFYSFQVPWLSVFIMLVVLFMIVGFSMLYSGSKVKKGSIVEAIKQDNL